MRTRIYIYIYRSIYNIILLYDKDNILHFTFINRTHLHIIYCTFVLVLFDRFGSRTLQVHVGIAGHSWIVDSVPDDISVQRRTFPYSSAQRRRRFRVHVRQNWIHHSSFRFVTGKKKL